MGARETMTRQWQLLQRLDANRRGWSTKELHDYLKNEGHDCSLRTVQRDLQFLDEVGFQIESEDGSNRLVSSRVGSMPPRPLRSRPPR